MAQTGTTVITLDSAEFSSSIRVIKYYWTSAVGGAVNTDTDSSGWAYSRGDGQLMCVVYVPGATTPTDLYDVTINDARGLDVLQGTGANISNAATVVKPYRDILTGGTDPGYINDYLPISGPLDLVIANAGDAKDGTIYLYIR